MTYRKNGFIEPKYEQFDLLTKKVEYEETTFNGTKKWPNSKTNGQNQSSIYFNLHKRWTPKKSSEK